MDSINFIISVILGILTIKNVRCQEFMTLNVPSTSPFMYHPSEHLMMDMSERHPVFLYASSQNDYLHQRLPEHHVVPPNLSRPHQRQRQNSVPKPQFTNSPPPAQRENKNRISPQLTYGFQPKPSSNRNVNHPLQKKNHQNLQKNQQNEGFRTRNIQKPHHNPSIRHETQQAHNPSIRHESQQAHSPSIRHETQQAHSPSIRHETQQAHNPSIRHETQQTHSPSIRHETQQAHNPSIRHETQQAHNPSILHEAQQAHNQIKQFAEHIHTQSSVQQKQQNENVASSNHQNGFGDFSQPFNYLSHILSPQRQFSSSTRPNNRNNQFHQNTGGESRKPISSNQRAHKPNEENRQESIRKRVTFEGAAQAFKSRLNNNNQGTAGTFPPKVFENHNRQNLPDRNQNNDERINMQQHARSLRENMPQLPPRPAFNNGGIKINTLAGELPILHLDSINTLNENPALYLQNDNHHDHEEQEKKTYLLIKAPSVGTTERPSSASFVSTSHKYTSSPPYMINDYRETSPNLPDITHSTLPEPRALPETAQTPAIVLDLVQIPDHAIFGHEEHISSPLQQPEFRSTDSRYKTEESFHSNKNYQQPEFQSVDNKFANEESLHSTKNYRQPQFRSVDNTYTNEETFHPTESYPTTPMQVYKDVVVHHKKNEYTSVPEYDYNAYYAHPKGRTYSTVSVDNNVKYQNKLTAKPKIKELLKSSNFSSLPPISYSSSVSVVSVKHNVDTRPSPPKKQKPTLKKASSNKKKAKIPENEHISYDDYDDGQGVPGNPGVDYPTYKDIPLTNFECKNEKAPGFYADTEAGCQVFHNCDTGMAKHSFMCPNGTVFNQELFICDWWYNVKCENSPEFYSLNSGLFITGNAQEESRRNA